MHLHVRHNIQIEDESGLMLFLCDKLPMFKRLSYCGTCGMRTSRADLMVDHASNCGRPYAKGDFLMLNLDTRVEFASFYAAKFDRLRDGREFTFGDPWRNSSKLPGVGRGLLCKIANQQDQYSNFDVFASNQHLEDDDDKKTTDSDDEFNFRNFSHRSNDGKDEQFEDAENLDWGTFEDWEKASNASSAAQTVVEVTKAAAVSTPPNSPTSTPSTPISTTLSAALKNKGELLASSPPDAEPSTPKAADVSVPTGNLLNIDWSLFDTNTPITEPWTPPLPSEEARLRTSKLLAASFNAPISSAEEGMAPMISKIIARPPQNTVYTRDRYDWRNLPARPNHDIREHFRREHDAVISGLMFNPAMIGELRSTPTATRKTRQRIYFQQQLKTGIYDVRGGNDGLRLVVVPHWLNSAAEVDDPKEDVTADQMTIFLTSMMTRPPMLTAIASIQTYLPMGEYELIPRDRPRNVSRMMVAEEG